MSDVELLDEVWQVPARTIDMLGRQQIANIPTALHELFKNAHDAYADRVTADFFRADGALLVRDDGDGMTMDQLRRGWLTLASSTKGEGGASGPRTDNKSPRPIMGSKGIGRLAIAAIGRQVLIMTRPRLVDGKPGPLLVSLVHWNVNQMSDVDLAKVVIPTARVVGGGVPDAGTVRMLAERLSTNVAGLRTPNNAKLADQALEDLAALDIDPGGAMANLPGPSLLDGGNGTHFYVAPVDEMLGVDLTAPADEVSQVQKYLLGFGNTMMPDGGHPPIEVTFNDHKADGATNQPIGAAEFFTPEDFLVADHAIDGTFDDSGQFEGHIKVYGGDSQLHTIAWRGGSGRTKCGPFRIRFAYIQGKAKDSRLSAEDYARVSGKLSRMGGLYVYRDGIRILPYGGPDQDFVGLEGRRNKSASDWFFSYRRIFGAVELTNAGNPNLKEKAGREGFIRDRAYQEFVSILVNFFERLAVDFFRDSSTFGEWLATRERLNKRAALIAAREKRGKGKRSEFVKSLERTLDKLDDARVASVAAKISADLDARLTAATDMPDPAEAGSALFEAEQRAASRIHDFEAGLMLSRPAGVALPKSRDKDWDFYVSKMAETRTRVLTPLRDAVRRRVDEAAAGRDLSLDRRSRVLTSVDDQAGRAEKAVARARARVDREISNLDARVRKGSKHLVAEVDGHIERTRADVARTDLEIMGDAEFGNARERWDQGIEDISRDATARLVALADQLVDLGDAIARGETLDQTTDAIEARAAELADRLDQYVDLAHLGTAVGIVQHEFAGAVTGVRNAIKRLAPWARANPGLATIDRDLRDGFEHLDAYLGLFAPLSRRLTATRIDVSGSEVEQYVDEVFRERLKRHGIEIGVGTAFRATTLTGQPSAILAAFVNVVDNAIHWTATAPEGHRRIVLDAVDGVMTVTNSGPGIEARVADRIFEYGETTRLGGRGLGLFVSREALRKCGLDLTLEAVGAKVPPVFAIGSRKADALAGNSL